MAERLVISLPAEPCEGCSRNLCYRDTLPAFSHTVSKGLRDRYGWDDKNFIFELGPAVQMVSNGCKKPDQVREAIMNFIDNTGIVYEFKCPCLQQKRKQHRAAANEKTDVPGWQADMLEPAMPSFI